jgi:hypothetical protein
VPILAFLFEQMMQYRFGLGGGAAAVLLLFGLRNKSELCQYVALISLLVAVH